MATVRWLISFRIRLITCFIFWNFSTKGGWRWGLDLDGILPSIFLPIPLGEPSKKKNTKFWTFIEKRYGHVLRGRGGQRAMSKVVFCKKSLFFWPLKSFSVLKYLHSTCFKTWTSISRTYPSPTWKISLLDLSEIDFKISNFFCQNVQTTVGGGGVKEPRPK